MMVILHNYETASHARDNIGDLCNRVAYSKERIVITRYGRSVLAMVPIHNVELLARYNERFGLNVGMHTSSIVETKDNFSALCAKVAEGKEIVIVTKSGTPRLAFVPLESNLALDELERVVNLDGLLEKEESTPIASVRTLKELKEKYGI